MSTRRSTACFSNNTLGFGMDMRVIRALVIVAGAVLLAGAGWVWWNLFRPLSSDALLRARFHQHRTELDRLAALAQADTQLVGAGHDWILMRFSVYVRDTPRFDRLLSEGEVLETGRQEFRRLLDLAGLRSVSRSDGKAVRFVVGSSGGIRKGIVYSERPLTPTRTALDGPDLARESRGMALYCPLAPQWYLFLEPSD